MTSSPVRAVFSGMLSLVSVLGFVAFFALLLSPAADSHMDQWVTHAQKVPVQIQGCTLRRNGDFRQYEVRCLIAYTFEGETYQETSTAWRSDSPFVTRSTLARALDTQLHRTGRFALLRHYAPHHPELVDERWITAPPGWLLVGLAFLGCMAFAISLMDPKVERRSDMVYARDEATGQQVLVNAAGTRSGMGRRQLTQTVAFVVAGLLCVYGLLNKPANAVSTFGVKNGLQPVPAQLVDCQHHWTGGRRGEDQIRCGFQYSVNGVAYTGRAEAVEFHLFPTNARMNAQIARFMRAPARVASIDPQHPEFAIASIDDAWFAPYTIGIFEGIVALILFVLLPFLLKGTVWTRT